MLAHRRRDTLASLKRYKDSSPQRAAIDDESPVLDLRDPRQYFGAMLIHVNRMISCPEDIVNRVLQRKAVLCACFVTTFTSENKLR